MRRSKFMDSGFLAEPRGTREPAGPRDAEGIAAHPPYRRLIQFILATKQVSGADAEDLGQDILLEVIAAATAGPIASVERLISRIARCRIADHFRREALRRCDAYEDERDGAALPDSQRTIPAQDRLYEERGRREALPLLLQRMEPELREVFCLIEIEGMSVAEVTETLGLPEATVRGRRDRARTRFDHLAGPIRAQVERGLRASRR